MPEGDRAPLQDYLARLPRAERGRLVDELFAASMAVQMATRRLAGVNPRPVSIPQFRSYLERGIQHLQTARDSLPV